MYRLFYSQKSTYRSFDRSTSRLLIDKKDFLLIEIIRESTLLWAARYVCFQNQQNRYTILLVNERVSRIKKKSHSLDLLIPGTAENIPNSIWKQFQTSFYDACGNELFAHRLKNNNLCLEKTGRHELKARLFSLDRQQSSIFCGVTRAPTGTIVDNLKTVWNHLYLRLSELQLNPAYIKSLRPRSFTNIKIEGLPTYFYAHA